MKRLEERRDVDLAWLAGSGRVAGEQPLGEGRRRRRKEASLQAKRSGHKSRPERPGRFRGPLDLDYDDCDLDRVRARACCMGEVGGADLYASLKGLSSSTASRYVVDEKHGRVTGKRMNDWHALHL